MILPLARPRYDAVMPCGVLRPDLIVVHKERREMLLLRGNNVLRSYRVALGPDTVGHKQREGDGRTPEGTYVIDKRNPKSRYHLALHISYPNEADRAYALQQGLDPGGEIMIHGLKDGEIREGDWTQGCLAVTDAEMDEIWSLVPDGTPIRIHP
jgi:murein L,D-transpeptidase YafK